MRTVLSIRGGGQPPSLSPQAVWAVLAILALLWWLQPENQSAVPGSGSGGIIEGPTRVIDGDSVIIAGREMRLKGIDAPEGRQHCTRNGADWACGDEARQHLQQLIGGRSVVCRSTEIDQHNRLLASCEVNGRSINAAMVEDGYAVSFGSYRAEESRAQAAKRGLWSGEFERPREWRDHHPRR